MATSDDPPNGRVREPDRRVGLVAVRPLADVAPKREHRLRQVGIRPGDSSLAATDVVLARRAAFVYAAAGIRFCAGTGSSGADKALLRDLDVSWLAGRFGALVVASGDGIFTEAAESAAAAGVQVWQVAGRGRTSARLRAAAERHCTLLLGPQRTGTPTPRTARRTVRRTVRRLG